MRTRRRWLALWRYQLRVDQCAGGTVKVPMLRALRRVEDRLRNLSWRPDRWGANV